MRIVLPLLALVAGVACSGNIGIEETPYCNGLLDVGETEIDDLFDRDGDGAFDVDAQCDLAYPPEQVDCDDDDPERHPGAEEVQCNGVDDDCSDDTPDDDGFGCNDGYNGLFTVSPAPQYSCAGAVSVNFSQVDVTHDGFVLKMDAVGSAQPGLLDGTVSSEDTFRVSRVIGGSCQESYLLEGSFSDPNNFTGVFTAKFYDSSGFGFCADCSDQSWNVTGTR